MSLATRLGNRGEYPRPDRRYVLANIFCSVDLNAWPDLNQADQDVFHLTLDRRYSYHADNSQCESFAMRCPCCGSRETRVLDKRDSDEVASTRRRRECSACARRFTTYERPELGSLMLIKKDGRRQEFDREKLNKALQKACTKLPISAETIVRIVDQIESDLRGRDVLEVSSSLVGDLVMDKLKALDKVAYIRFASVYRAFADVSSFEDELRQLLTT